MNSKEIRRLEVIQKLLECRLTQNEAAEKLGCTTRNIRYLLSRYKENGPPGLVNKHRGRPSNRLYSIDFKAQVLQLISERYSDFGPSFVAEKLHERENILLSKETIRKWMTQEQLWCPKKERPRRAHPPRQRRSCYGELIQIDGSPHDWFEGRSAKCTLIVFIDDATSRIQAMQFFPTETTEAYFEVTQRYIERHGMPQGIYSDKHGIFRMNHPDPENSLGLTQFGRAMKALGVDLIHANSPQAKGRVERSNRTLQDRLTKEMRLDGIDDMTMANGLYLENFIEKHNQKFAIEPLDAQDVHCCIENPQDLKLHFTHQELRKVSKNLCISYRNKKYVLKKPDKAKGLYRAQVIVCEAGSGEITVLYKGQSLEYEVYDKNQYKSEVVSRKESLAPSPLKPRRRTIPAADHPWRPHYRAS